MRVLVTGGAGYIGSHACKALAKAGHEPVVFDNLELGHEWAVKWGPLFRGDIRDPEALDAAITTEKVEAVMHFAAFAYVGESVADPSIYYDNNVVGSLCLLNAMRRHGLDKIIFSSSCATYGMPDVMPISETTPQVPINPYGRTKLMVEHALADFGHAYGIRSTSLRYFNAAGADPEGELGEVHDPETRAIPLAIFAALGVGPRFSVMGSDYDTPDGTAIRDYIHVADLATAHVAALDYLEAGGKSMPFNLATGNGVSVKQVVDAAAQATGRPVPYDLVPRRAGDPPVLYAQAKRAHDVLGWAPKFTEIADTVQTAAEWHMRRHNSYS